jgi:hypothetical protein
MTPPDDIEMPEEPRQKRWQFSLRTLLLFVAVAALPFAGVRYYYSWMFPYGWSHCCDKALMFALEEYARDHGGHYPSGKECPEASLSLLYPKYADANLLRGKTVPEAAVRGVLENGKLLGPKTCGWQYVEGLTQEDRGAALLWDKVGLGHNGQRLSTPGHTVIFIGHDIRFIPESEWATFLEEQKALREDRFSVNAKRSDDRIDASWDADRVTFVINSPAGISSSSIRRREAEWPSTVVVRLRLRGLEQFTVDNGRTQFIASVRSHSGHRRELSVKRQGKETLVKPGGEYWTRINVLDANGKPIEGLPGADGYFEIVLPAALFEGNPESLALAWVDFYR